MKTRTKQTFRIFWQHSRRYPWAIFVMTLALIGAICAELLGPFYYKQLFNILSTPNGTAAQLLEVIFLILATGGANWAFWRLATFANNFFQPRVMTDIVNSSFKYLQDHSYNFFSNNFAGSLVKKVGRLERAFEDITDQLYWSLVPAALKVGSIVVILYFVKPLFGWAVLFWSLVYVMFSIIFARYKLKYDIQNANLDTQVGGRLADTISNNINLKLFGGTGSEFKSFKQLTY